MNDQSTQQSQVLSNQKEIIETIVFEPIHTNRSEWSQTGRIDQVPNYRVRLVSFDGPEELGEKLQEVMMSSFHNDNEDDEYHHSSTGTFTSLSSHHHSSVSWQSLLSRVNGDSCSFSRSYLDDSMQYGSMEEDEADWSDFDESNFTFSPTSYQIPVIPEPPMQAFGGEQGEIMEKVNRPCQITKKVRPKGIKLDDVLRTRLWGKCLRLSSSQQRRTTTGILRRQACPNE